MVLNSHVYDADDMSDALVWVVRCSSLGYPMLSSGLYDALIRTIRCSHLAYPMLSSGLSSLPSTITTCCTGIYIKMTVLYLMMLDSHAYDVDDTPDTLVCYHRSPPLSLSIARDLPSRWSPIFARLQRRRHA